MTLVGPVYIFLGLVLLRSAAIKLRKPAAFWSILQRYPGGGWFRTARLARLLPALELALAGALVLPLPWSRIPAGYVTLVFLSVASAGIYARYRRGEDRFACGCSGNLEEETEVSSMLLRNGALSVSVCYVTLAQCRSSTPIDYAMGLALLFAFELFQTALIQNEKIRKWKTPTKSVS